MKAEASKAAKQLSPGLIGRLGVGKRWGISASDAQKMLVHGFRDGPPPNHEPKHLKRLDNTNHHC